MPEITSHTWEPEFERWRHGGWYVTNVHYPSGACGCVSNNYADKKWRIACYDRNDISFSTRRDAAAAELLLTEVLRNMPSKMEIRDHRLKSRTGVRGQPEAG